MTPVKSKFLKVIHHLLPLFLICCLFTNVAYAHKPLLWKVEGKDSAGFVYLFGSLHYGAPEFYPLPEAVLEAFRVTDALAVELDIDNLPVEQLHNALHRAGLYSGERNLRDLLSGKSWKALEKICQDLAIDCKQFLQTKPWLVAMQLTNLQLVRSNYQQSLGLDKYFLTEARNKKTILELESLTEQLQLFSQLSDAEQIKFFEVTLAEFDKSIESLEKLAAAWLHGDEEALNTLVFSAFRKHNIGKKLYQLIFVERNHQMLNAIDGYLKSSQKIFLVVGVGHMLGDDGLVALLEKKGYQIILIDTESNIDES